MCVLTAPKRAPTPNTGWAGLFRNAIIINVGVTGLKQPYHGTFFFLFFFKLGNRRTEILAKNPRATKPELYIWAVVGFRGEDWRGISETSSSSFNVNFPHQHFKAMIVHDFADQVSLV
jgi:hypothetical protein